MHMDCAKKLYLSNSLFLSHSPLLTRAHTLQGFSVAHQDSVHVRLPLDGQVQRLLPLVQVDVQQDGTENKASLDLAQF